MYRNLEAELTRNGIKKRQLAEKLEITYGTLSQKLNGKSPFTLAEAKAIKEIVGGELTLEYLFDINNKGA